ncbi:hypothetical protein [Nocardia terpenica]|uniref:Uncharacterized protein n=1 Tax=Nocardia terpenica TaxID=455432 RepID=A0A6G9ZE12_9NOCA|nr:hypothetical protein [Nocardia terpenica]QIS23680.1 hypothetical protein F6W96_40810 [Nocardia terpenica]
MGTTITMVVMPPRSVAEIVTERGVFTPAAVTVSRRANIVGLQRNSRRLRNGG